MKDAKKKRFNEMIRARSPGKLIISGEHAVVYGKPAIAMAVDRFAETTVTPQLSKMISFNLLSSRYKESYTLQMLREIKHRLADKYHQFIEGECGIREVLQTPVELTQYAFINMVDHLNSKIANGLNITTESNIPMQCGMGSSAAAVLTVLFAITNFLGISLKRDHFLKLACETENLQHGYSSGVDLRISMDGGCIYYQQNEAENRAIPAMPMYLVNTGQPAASTGDCVSAVKQQIGDHAIWNEFETITQAIDEVLQLNQYDDFQKLVRENHRLLVEIGVVPEKVQHFIHAIEQQGGAAKVCGAGAVAGDQAGVVLVLSDDVHKIESVCDQYHYDCAPVQGDAQGLHTV